MGTELTFAGNGKEHFDLIYNGPSKDSTSFNVDMFNRRDSIPPPKSNVNVSDTLPKLDINFLMAPRSGPNKQISLTTPEDNQKTDIVPKVAPTRDSNSTTAAQKPPVVERKLTALEEKQLADQQYLLAHTGEMRKLWTQTYSDVSTNKNGHLDKYEIDKGLSNKSLPEVEHNFLVVLKKGYAQLSLTALAESDEDGVSAKSLQVLDKAMNRTLNEDPIYKARVFADVGVGVGVGLIAMLRQPGNLKDKGLYGLGAFGVATLVGEGRDLLMKLTGGFDRQYDVVQNSYLSFVKDYRKQTLSDW